tara:strand:- start:291 stop:4511 length:4221 start_codon:yes stop_codon:yes gene_type:complete
MWDDLEEEETAVGPLRLGPVEVDDAEMNGVEPGEVNQRVAKALEKEHGVCVREEGEVFGVPVMKTEERNALKDSVLSEPGYKRGGLFGRPAQDANGLPYPDGNDQLFGFENTDDVVFAPVTQEDEAADSVAGLKPLAVETKQVQKDEELGWEASLVRLADRKSWDVVNCSSNWRTPTVVVSRDFLHNAHTTDASREWTVRRGLRGAANANRVAIPDEQYRRSWTLRVNKGNTPGGVFVGATAARTTRQGGLEMAEGLSVGVDAFGNVVCGPSPAKMLAHAAATPLKTADGPSNPKRARGASSAALSFDASENLWVQQLAKLGDPVQNSSNGQRHLERYGRLGLGCEGAVTSLSATLMRVTVDVKPRNGQYDPVLIVEVNPVDGVDLPSLNEDGGDKGQELGKFVETAREMHFEALSKEAADFNERKRSIGVYAFRLSEMSQNMGSPVAGSSAVLQKLKDARLLGSAGAPSQQWRLVVAMHNEDDRVELKADAPLWYGGLDGFGTGEFHYVQRGSESGQTPQNVSSYAQRSFASALAPRVKKEVYREGAVTVRWIEWEKPKEEEVAAAEEAARRAKSTYDNDATEENKRLWYAANLVVSKKRSLYLDERTWQPNTGTPLEQAKRSDRSWRNSGTANVKPGNLTIEVAPGAQRVKDVYYYGRYAKTFAELQTIVRQSAMERILKDPLGKGEAEGREGGDEGLLEPVLLDFDDKFEKLKQRVASDIREEVYMKVLSRPIRNEEAREQIEKEQAADEKAERKAKREAERASIRRRDESESRGRIRRGQEGQQQLTGVLKPRRVTDEEEYRLFLPPSLVKWWSDNSVYKGRMEEEPEYWDGNDSNYDMLARLFKAALAPILAWMDIANTATRQTNPPDVYQFVETGDSVDGPFLRWDQEPVWGRIPWDSYHPAFLGELDKFVEKLERDPDEPLRQVLAKSRVLKTEFVQAVLAPLLAMVWIRNGTWPKAERGGAVAAALAAYANTKFQEAEGDSWWMLWEGFEIADVGRTTEAEKYEEKMRQNRLEALVRVGQLNAQQEQKRSATLKRVDEKDEEAKRIKRINAAHQIGQEDKTTYAPLQSGDGDVQMAEAGGGGGRCALSRTPVCQSTEMAGSCFFQSLKHHLQPERPTSYRNYDTAYDGRYATSEQPYGIMRGGTMPGQWVYDLRVQVATWLGRVPDDDPAQKIINGVMETPELRDERVAHFRIMTGEAYFAQMFREGEEQTLGYFTDWMRRVCTTSPVLASEAEDDNLLWSGDDILYKYLQGAFTNRQPWLYQRYAEYVKYPKMFATQVEVLAATYVLAPVYGPIRICIFGPEQGFGPGATTTSFYQRTKLQDPGQRESPVNQTDDMDANPRELHLQWGGNAIQHFVAIRRRPSDITLFERNQGFGPQDPMGVRFNASRFAEIVRSFS